MIAIPIYQNLTITQLYENFLAFLNDRIQREEVVSKEVTRNRVRLIQSTQSNEVVDTKKKADHEDKKKSRSKKDVKYWKCNKKGHYSNKCSNKRASESLKEIKAPEISPPISTSNEYCLAENGGISGSSYVLKLQH
ncbi:hypothetical protein GcM1_218023 [Golovinomyces cichoracearum]|uniref:CCHC-type domain-containing protein n=1 Tax=Golovinomyces cichoracearum TaxID=62708 RepID=A0A420ISN5_9PEZI|nr:hypothetical protein GcM1_218023 [Golovinomyces cichoracearum]